jgi:oxalate decarboxylase
LVAESAFDGFPAKEVYFARGAIPPEKMPENLQGARTAPPQTHKFRMLSEAPHGVFKGGREWRVDSTRFPISTTVTGAILDLEPGALRELHWHPNADEWQYIIEGDVNVTMFIRTGVSDGTPAHRDAGYIPRVTGTNRERRQRRAGLSDSLLDLIDRSSILDNLAIRWTLPQRLTA